MRLATDSAVMVLMTSLSLMTSEVHSLARPLPLLARSDQDHQTSRTKFIRRLGSATFAAVAGVACPSASNSIEFVPASPFYSGSYDDGREILQTQRLALDNVGTVLEDGNLAEAGFKVQQLSSQVKAGWTIVLRGLQSQIRKQNANQAVLRVLSCQKRFNYLLEVIEALDDSMSDLIRKSRGDGDAAANARGCIILANDAKAAYDDFLRELRNAEDEFSRTNN